ncbi:MAG TPA: hypothetical protein PKA51_12495 [Kiritimatiellia bacterium]|nr:hypothetical protein [Kiritimatiellia bacterium]
MSFYCRLVSLFLVGAGWFSARAATLTTVPMQGGMVMPMIAYHADPGHLHVMMPTNVPQLTPLLVSHPADQFDPAHPWFTDLDPSAKGLSFSRRYGWVMDGDSDPLPPNTQIWLRKISGDPGLNVFRYSATPAPGVWEPILGTAGSALEMPWNMMMFHPAFTALPGTHTFTATFEAYLVDTVSGEEIPDTATMPMVFHFTNMPDGRPELAVGTSVHIAWDAGATNYVLESTVSLSSGSWSVVSNHPVMIDGRQSVLLTPGEGAGKYFRMRRVP